MLERIHTESTLHERDPGTLAAAAARPAQTALPPARARPGLAHPRHHARAAARTRRGAGDRRVHRGRAVARPRPRRPAPGHAAEPSRCRRARRDPVRGLCHDPPARRPRAAGLRAAAAVAAAAAARRSLRAPPPGRPRPAVGGGACGVVRAGDRRARAGLSLRAPARPCPTGCTCGCSSCTFGRRRRSPPAWPGTCPGESAHDAALDHLAADRRHLRRLRSRCDRGLAAAARAQGAARRSGARHAVLFAALRVESVHAGRMEDG